MHIYALCSLLLTFFCSLAASLETDRSVDIHTWPLSSPKSASYAQLAYNSTHANIKRHNNPGIPPNDGIVRLGFHNSLGTWSGIATSASNFGPEKDKTLQLHVNSEGVVYHIGFKVSELGTSSKGSNKKDDLSVEVVRPLSGPIPHLNRPVVVNPDGSAAEEEKVEKTFLQKYWWAIAGFVSAPLKYELDVRRMMLTFMDRCYYKSCSVVGRESRTVACSVVNRCFEQSTCQAYIWLHSIAKSSVFVWHVPKSTLPDCSPPNTPSNAPPAHKPNAHHGITSCSSLILVLI